MSARQITKLTMATTVNPVLQFMQRPLRLIRTYDRANLRPDLVAGITVAVILLPQAIAFAVIVELPPQMGLYTAVMGSIIGALWGSSNQVHTGPANAISLMVLSSLVNTSQPGTAEFMVAAGLMALMVGVFQLFMGLARLGILVNFVSHSVIVGFASGAGVLIAVKQLGPLLGLSVSGRHLLEIVGGLISVLPSTHVPTALLGVTTIALILLMRRINPKLPGALLSMVAASIIVFLGRLDQTGVAVIGQLPSGFPPMADLPIFDLELMGRLSAGSLAVGAIGLVQTVAIARSVSTQTGQRLDSNQEFVGQGLANIFSGLFSGYACAGSFSRSAVNFKVGARSPMAAVFSGVFVLLAMLALAPLTSFLPRAALSGVLMVIAYNMIDRQEIARIWRGTRGDAVIMLVTFLGTLLLDIEFAVLAGILFSFARYIMRTSAPRVHAVLPDESYKHFTYQPEKEPCPQMGIIDVLGDLYFGAVGFIEEKILAYSEQHPEQRFLLIRMHSVNQCDFSGIHMLESIVRSYRDRGGDVFIVRAGYRVRRVMASTGFDENLGRQNFLPEDDAISHIFYKVLDPAICIYECPVRAFKECQNLPKRVDVLEIPRESKTMAANIPTVEARQLWQQLHPSDDIPPPLVVDVREPREFKQGHIPDAKLVPLPTILRDMVSFPNGRQIVLVCRSGRRSRRAALALQQNGDVNVAVLEGGMLAWEAAGLLEAIE